MKDSLNNIELEYRPLIENINLFVCGVYKITNNINNKCYIGSSVCIQIRFRRHISSLIRNTHENSYLQRSWNKYLPKNFKFEVLEVVVKSNLLLREQYYIDSLKPEYNLFKIAGSPLGFKHTEESKLKMSIIVKERIKNDPQSKAKILKAVEKSKVWTEERKAKLSNSLKGRIVSKETIQKRAEKLKGIKRPQHVIEAVKIANTGRKFTEEHKLKLSIAHKGIRLNRRKVIIQYDKNNNFIKEWTGVSIVAKTLSIKRTMISLCLTNRINLAGGFIWKYKKK